MGEHGDTFDRMTPDAVEEWDGEFNDAWLELMCERLACGKFVMEGFSSGGANGPFYCSLACLVEEGHDPAEAYDTRSELGDDASPSEHPHGR